MLENIAVVEHLLLCSNVESNDTPYLGSECAPIWMPLYDYMLFNWCHCKKT